MSVPVNYRTEQPLSNETNETMRMNTDNRKTNDSIDDLSKIATSTHPTVETLRLNSPTFKRLVAVRIKLEKYLVVISNTVPPSQQIVSQTSNYEKPVTATTATSEKRIKSKTKSSTAPLDKITYEKTRTNNGNIKQKCSLEIWLPKAGSDDDDGNTTRTATPDLHTIGNNSQSLQAMPIKSRQSNMIKSFATNSETKSLDELIPKKYEPKIIPRVYHYEEYLTDQGEERPRSGKSRNTNKSDGSGSNKHLRRQRTRSNLWHLSPTTGHTEETTVQWPSAALSMSAKNLLANTKQNSAGSEMKGTSNSTSTTMINELMKKYSLIKKNHQELTQPRLLLEKSNLDPKNTTHINKGNLSMNK
jgi:hypothetical protein